MNQPEIFSSEDMPEASKTVSFRLNKSDHQLFSEQAKLANMTVGALAKQRAFESSAPVVGQSELGPRMEAIENHLVALRGDLILSAEALLFAAGKFTPEQAKAWVNQKLS